MIRINLLREPTQKAAAWSTEKSQIGLYATLLLLVAFAGMGWWYWYLLDQHAARVALRDQLQQERILLHKAKAELEKYEVQKRMLDHRIRVIEQLKANQKGPILLMNGVIASVPEKPSLWLNSLMQKENLVTIEGRALNLDSVADFIASLNQAPPFKQVELDHLEEDGASIKFSLSCDLGK